MFKAVQIYLLKACNIVGSQAKLANVIGVTPGQISQWINRGDRISYEHILAIEEAAEREITRYQIAPQIKYFELKNKICTSLVNPQVLSFIKKVDKKLYEIQKHLLKVNSHMQFSGTPINIKKHKSRTR